MNQYIIIHNFQALTKLIESCSSEAVVRAVIKSWEREMQVIVHERKAIYRLEVVGEAVVVLWLKSIVSTVHFLLYQIYLISEHFLNT